MKQRSRIRLGWVAAWASLWFGLPSLSAQSPYANMVERIEKLDASPLVAVRSLVQTAENRKVYLLTLGSESPSSRPAVLVVGNVVASQIAGSELALGLAEWLVNHAADDRVRKILESTTLYILPRPNPDGTERFFSAPRIEADGNGRKTDDDRDFSFGEDPPDDLNGDGFITQMRIRDAAGTYRPHPDDPRVMILADAARGEVGTHRLLPEGIDQDHDEMWNEDGGYGVSFDQNFPVRYPFFAKSAGPNAVSEPETRAVADFCFDHPEIAAVFSFGPQDNLLAPPKAAGDEKIKTKPPAEDIPYFEHFAKRYQEIVGSKGAPPPSEKGGAFSEWAYLQWGRPSFTSRGWWIPPKEPAPTPDKKEPEKKEEPEKKDASEKKKDDRGAADRRALEWFAEQKTQGFVEWKPFAHPDFPGKEVEIGGIIPGSTTLPPAAVLATLVEKHAQFVLELAEAIPSVAVEPIIDRPNGGNVVRLTARLKPQGYLPTMSKMGEIAETVHPLTWEWTLPAEVKLVGGTRRGQSAPLRSGTEGKVEALFVVPSGPIEIIFTIKSPSVRPIDPVRFKLGEKEAR